MMFNKNRKKNESEMGHQEILVCVDVYVGVSVSAGKKKKKEG